MNIPFLFCDDKGNSYPLNRDPNPKVVLHCQQYIAALAALGPREKIKSGRYKGETARQQWAKDAYSLKHRAENWHPEKGFGEYWNYVSAEDFIAAAVLSGIKVRKVRKWEGDGYICSFVFPTFSK